MQTWKNSFIKKIRNFINPHEFLFIIGEEAAVCALFIHNIMVSKILVRSTQGKDVQELDQLLRAHPNAEISLYIDVLDQNYLQKTLPSVDIFNITSLANKRLEKETPATHLKAALRIGRGGEGRKDWFYVFISAAYDIPLSNWVNFLLQYSNPIIGLHFLPVELVHLVNAIRKKQNQKLSFLQWAKKKFLDFQMKKQSQAWDMLLVYNKSGGLRQAVYQNGKIIFTRLLSNIFDPNAEVMAGNIEQEIANSIDYLYRLSYQSKDLITVYLVLSAELKDCIRANKIKASQVYLYTPYEVCTMLGIVGNVSKEHDKFSEPLILAVLKKVNSNIITTYTALIYKSYYLYKITGYIRKTIALSIPILIFYIGHSFLDLFYLNRSINNNLYLKNILDQSLNHTEEDKEQILKDFGNGVNIPALLETIQVAEFLNKDYMNPLDIITQFSLINPEVIKVQALDFNYNPQHIVYHQDHQISMFNNFNLQITIKIMNQSQNYDLLLKEYQEFSQKIRLIFSGYELKVGALPTNLSFNQSEDYVLINCEIANGGINAN